MMQMEKAGMKPSEKLVAAVMKLYAEYEKEKAAKKAQRKAGAPAALSGGEQTELTIKEAQQEALRSAAALIAEREASSEEGEPRTSTVPTADTKYPWKKA